MSPRPSCILSLMLCVFLFALSAAAQAQIQPADFVIHISVDALRNPNVAYKSSTFDVVHDNGLSTALYTK